ncbi:hypothetical protein BGX38DRAFT_101992 [Terfezia claveryi]|uniref:Uncharacterized protein n=1 Tax=Terfezia boudieri ATCC MYA-4762 TaxID=1051890 RepID=A0A3N4LT40_9PEZI|nr:hypothetical protein BGX38DRAFT_101992 [Terfezia claveryi]RPB26094.1 hypothetical protein L211DRAFT_693697 [Terfezia boudieri ATCC MYA-4762]
MTYSTIALMMDKVTVILILVAGFLSLLTIYYSLHRLCTINITLTKPKSVLWHLPFFAAIALTTLTIYLTIAFTRDQAASIPILVTSFILIFTIYYFLYRCCNLSYNSTLSCEWLFMYCEWLFGFFGGTHVRYGHKI